MIITFKELGINPADYTGMCYGLANALIVDKACDYIMNHHYIGEGSFEAESNCLVNVDHACADFITGTVEVQTTWDAPYKMVRH